MQSTSSECVFDLLALSGRSVVKQKLPASHIGCPAIGLRCVWHGPTLEGQDGRLIRGPNPGPPGGGVGNPGPPEGVGSPGPPEGGRQPGPTARNGVRNPGAPRGHPHPRAQ